MDSPLADEWPKVGDLFEHNDDALRQIAWHQEFLAPFAAADRRQTIM
jgi:hypothetical protein